MGLQEEEEEREEDADSVGYHEEPLGDGASTASSSYAVSSPSERIEDRRLCHSLSSEPDSVSEESGYGEEREDAPPAPATRSVLFHSDSLYSEDDLIILEEELDDLTVTSL